MLLMPADMPSALSDTLDLAGRLGGVSSVFDPSGKLVYANDAFRSRYNFMDIGGISYDDLFWASVRMGLFGANEMRMSAEEYFVIAKGILNIHDQLDFIKRYKHGTMIAHYNAINGWSVQVRISTCNPLWRGGFAGVAPKSLSEAAGAADATKNMRKAIDTLSTGMMFMAGDGGVLWCNAAGEHALAGLCGVSIVDGRIVFEDCGLGAEFAGALAAVLAGKALKRKYIALPTRRNNNVLMCSIVPHLNGEAVVLLAPQLDNGNLRAALLGFGLSPAECDVALLSAEGYNTSAVADVTGKSINTVRVQLGAVQRKFAEGRRASRTGAVGMTLGLSAVTGVK
jgi:DNA-binding CsgD family transcriptional regulator